MLMAFAAAIALNDCPPESKTSTYLAMKPGLFPIDQIMKITALLLLLIALAFPVSGLWRSAQADDVTAMLTIIDSASERSFTIEQLKQKLNGETIVFYHPYYDREKTFEAFPLRDFLQLMFADSKNSTHSSTVEFLALDGYQSAAAWEKLVEPGSYLVFRDVELPEWEIMPKRKVSPGPFAIVWTGKQQTWKNGYPWPWQLHSIRLSKGPE
jgi:hypothetical protein